MSQFESYLLGKEAETSGTNLMPYTAPSAKGEAPPSPVKTIPKTGEALEQGEAVKGEQYDKAPQASPVKLRVDTTGKEPPKVITTKEAQYYALPSQRRYPIDSYGHVKLASTYFYENVKLMTPEMRREYCQNLTKRASALGIKVSAPVQKYGASTYAPEAEFEAAISSRVGVIKEAHLLDALGELKMLHGVMLPDDFAVALHEFDKVAGIEELYGKDVVDPYYTTFGVKTAEAEADADGSFLVGNDYVTYSELRRFARANANLLCDLFGEDFVKEFRKDPVSIVSSLPADQKKIVIRLVTSTTTDPTPT